MRETTPAMTERRTGRLLRCAYCGRSRTRAACCDGTTRLPYDPRTLSGRARPAPLPAAGTGPRANGASGVPPAPRKLTGAGPT